MRDALGEIALLLIMAAVLSLGVVEAAGRQVPPRRPLDTAAYLLMGAALVVLSLRRRWPAVALAGTAALSAAMLTANYPYGPIVFTASVSMYALAVRRPLRDAVAGFALALAILMVPQVRLGVSDRALAQGVGLLGAWAALLAIPGWLGVTVRIWRAYRADALERRLQSGQLALERARRVVSEERLRLSREVHDVIAHNLSVISLQAGVALHKFDRRPAEARQSLEAIRRTSTDALSDLRTTLDALRAPGDAGLAEPRLDQLADLAGRMTRSGLLVRLEERGRKPPPEPPVEAAAYRIVQESLSNVVRHARATTADVRLDYSSDGIRIEVTDDGHGPGAPAGGGTGHGIEGMRERARAHDGWLETGRAASGGFRVRAWLPLRRGER